MITNPILDKLQNDIQYNRLSRKELKYVIAEYSHISYIAKLAEYKLKEKSLLLKLLRFIKVITHKLYEKIN